MQGRSAWNFHRRRIRAFLINFLDSIVVSIFEVVYNFWHRVLMIQKYFRLMAGDFKMSPFSDPVRNLNQRIDRQQDRFWEDVRKSHVDDEKIARRRRRGVRRHTLLATIQTAKGRVGNGSNSRSESAIKHQEQPELSKTKKKRKSKYQAAQVQGREGETKYKTLLPARVKVLN